MAQYFRIKEITGPATVLRQGTPLNIFLGDFIYPDEVDTIVSDTPIVYWDDNTSEHFTWAPAAAPVTPPAPAAPAPKAPVAPAPKAPEATAAE